jgi:hypothetical protein
MNLSDFGIGIDEEYRGQFFILLFDIPIGPFRANGFFMNFNLNTL